MIKEIEKMGYRFEGDKFSIKIIRNQTGKEKWIPYNDVKVCFIGAENCKDIKQAEQLVNEGKAYMMTHKEIYHALYEYTESEKYKLENGYSLETSKYLEEEKESIGFVQVNYGEAFENGKVLGRHQIFFNTTDIEVRQSDTLFVAEYLQQIEIDDCEVSKYYFKHVPHPSEIIKAILVADTETMIRTQECEEYKCINCGTHQHWLNVEGDLRAKYNAMKQRLCAECAL